MISSFEDSDRFDARPGCPIRRSRRHKIESYYLNPRLTARHVRLPGFVLILSLLAWEHLLGFVGLFASFPFLFVAGRIAAEWRAEKAS